MRLERATIRECRKCRAEMSDDSMWNRNGETCFPVPGRLSQPIDFRANTAHIATLFSDQLPWKDVWRKV